MSLHVSSKTAEEEKRVDGDTSGVLCIRMTWQPDSAWEPCSGSSLWGEVALSAASHAAQGGLGVSALYPPHLHGLTQFSNG